MIPRAARVVIVSISAGLGLVFVGTLALLFMLHGGSIFGGPNYVPVTSQALAGAWQGEKGMRIEFGGNGSFTAEDWPTQDLADGSWGPESYSGTWDVQQGGDGGVALVDLNMSVMLSAQWNTPDSIQMIRRGHAILLCLEDDPDSPCDLGTLARVSGH